VAKTALKRRTIEENGNCCAETGAPLPSDMSLFDTHRLTPKSEGGDYSKENTVVVLPLAHMKKHKTLRVLTPELNELKCLIDERVKLMQARVKINNQIKAYERETDTPSAEIMGILKNLLLGLNDPEKEREKSITKWIKSHVKSFRILEIMNGVKAVGPITMAYCLIYLEPAKARHASSFWKYAGLHAPSDKRYVKTKAGGGNQRLRTCLYAMADSQIKNRGPYRQVYDNTKIRLENSDKITRTMVRRGDGRVEKAWKDTMPCHRHGAAMRQVMKHFLADLWYVWRTIEGLPVGPLYPEAILGGNHRTIMPEERGWIY